MQKIYYTYYMDIYDMYINIYIYIYNYITKIYPCPQLSPHKISKKNLQFLHSSESLNLK